MVALSPLALSTLTRRDLSIAAAFAAVALAVYLAFPQPWLWGDGYAFAHGLHSDVPDARYGMHVAYMTLGRMVERIVPALGPFGALHFVAASSAALGLGASLLVALRLGAHVWAALAASALYAVAPTTWFFATVIELHTVHLAAVAIVVLAILCLPWQRPWTSGAVLWVLCLSLPLTHLSAPLLVPGLLLLVHVAARAGGRTEGLLRTTLVAAPILASSMFAALGIAGALRGRTGDPVTLGTIGRQITEFPGMPSAAWWWEDIALAHAWSGALFLAGLVVLRSQRTSLALVASFVLPAVVFHAWWGVANAGGYFVPLAPFVIFPGAVLLAKVAARRALAPVVVAVFGVALVPQFRIAREYAAVRMAVFDTVDRAARADQVRAAIGEHGFFVSFDPTRNRSRASCPASSK